MPLLGPPGHGGVGALQAPVPAAQLETATSQRSRTRKGRHPPGDPALNRARSPSRARLRRVLRMAQAPLLTVIFHGSFGAYRKDEQVRAAAVLHQRTTLNPYLGSLDLHILCKKIPLLRHEPLRQLVVENSSNGSLRPNGGLA